MKRINRVNKAVAVVTIAIACHWLASCHHHSDAHRQTLDFIAQAQTQLEQENLDSAWALLTRADKLAQQSHDPAGAAEARIVMVQLQQIKGNVDSATAILNECLEIAPQIPDPLKAMLYAELSAAANIKGDMQESVRYGLMALPLLEQGAPIEEYATMCGTIGIGYRRLGNNDSAAYFYRKGIDAALRMHDDENIAYLCNNLSVLYCDMGHLDEACGYADKAREAATRSSDDEQRLSAAANKGVALLFKKQTDEATRLLTDAYSEAQGTDFIYLKLKLINYLLKALTEGGGSRQLIDRYLADGEQIAGQLPPGNTGAAGILESKLLLQIDRGQYQDAMSTIAQIENLMRQQQVIPAYKLMYNKARCLAGMGDHKQAYQLMAGALELCDSIKSKEAGEKLSRLTASYEMTQKKLEIAQLNEQQSKSQTRIAVLAAIVVALLAAMGTLLLWVRARRQKAQMRETRRWIEGIEQERSRFARELHDGACNDLLAIGMQLRGDRPDVQEVNSQIATLRAQLRNLSHELMPPQFKDGVRLDEALAHYLGHIESLEVKFTAQGEGWDKVPADTAYQIYRIAQEAMGNIITHQADAQVEVHLAPKRLDIVSRGQIMDGDGNGIGMQSMSDRAGSIGAKLATGIDGDTFAVGLDF